MPASKQNAFSDFQPRQIQYETQSYESVGTARY